MSYTEAKEKYAVVGIDTEAALTKLKTVPLSLHCWQGNDVRGFDTDPTKPLTGGIQTTGSYPGRARTPQELMEDIEEVLKLCPRHEKAEPSRQLRHFRPWRVGRPGQIRAEALHPVGGILQKARPRRGL